jgi:hypothetical protein
VLIFWTAMKIAWNFMAMRMRFKVCTSGHAAQHDHPAATGLAAVFADGRQVLILVTEAPPGAAQPNGLVLSPTTCATCLLPWCRAPASLSATVVGTAPTGRGSGAGGGGH